MGTIIDFPADARLRRRDSWQDDARPETLGTIVILPVIRIERHSEETGGRGPEEGTRGRRRRRRARS